MQVMVGVIDTVYAWVITFSMRCVEVAVFPWTDTQQEGYEIPEEYDSIELLPKENTTSTFKTMRDVLGGYQRNIATSIFKETVTEEQSEIQSKESVSTHKVIQDTPTAEVSLFTTKNTIMYADSIHVPVYKNPTIEFDAQIGEIPYGEMIIVLEPKGRFYRIVWNTLEGWVLRDDIADRAIRVFPEFTIGEENSVDHPNTAHVRAIIDDAFGLGRSEFPLQAGEYILYRLWKKRIQIVWSSVRPRVPGAWHKILKGTPNVRIGVTPKIGAVMEYMMTSEMGHLAFVEAIFPDDTITISEANFPDLGIYNERVLTKEEWKELHPVFLTIS